MIKKSKKSFVLYAISLIGLFACSDETKDIANTNFGKTYSTTITLSPAKGKPTDIATRGIDPVNGEFTTMYPYDYIYLHVADNEYGDEHKRIKIPLDKVPHCSECKGVHLSLTEEGEDYSITARSYYSNQDTTLNLKTATDKIYFSTEDKHYWEAKTLGEAPFDKPRKVLSNDKGLNKEILRSKDIYDFTSFRTFLQVGSPVIEMTRHCNGFRLYFMFTNVNIVNGNPMNIMDSTVWTNYLKDDLKVSNLEILLYLGPYFAFQYDLLKKQPFIGDTNHDGYIGDYYSTNNNQFTAFRNVSYVYQGGGSDFHIYQGYGYQSEDYDYMLAPIVKTPGLDDLVKVTCVVKANYSNETSKSMYFDVIVPGMKLEPDMSRIHFIILAFDYRDLKIFKSTGNEQQSSRNSTEKPEKVVLKPFKIIYK